MDCTCITALATISMLILGTLAEYEDVENATRTICRCLRRQNRANGDDAGVGEEKLSRQQLQNLVSETRARFRIFPFKFHPNPKLSKKDCGKSKSGYRIEKFFAKKLHQSSSSLITQDVAEADMVYLESFPCDVRYYYPNDYSRGKNEAMRYIQRATEAFQAFSRRRNIQKVIFIVSGHDMGKSVGELVSVDLLNHSVYMTNSADTTKFLDETNHSWNPAVDVSATGAVETDKLLPASHERPFLIFFEGTIHKNNVIRNVLNASLPRLQEVSFNARKAGLKTMGKSEFCLCPSGHRGWTPRLVQAIRSTCIPVLFKEWHREYFPPFYCLLDWASLAVFIPAGRANETYQIVSGLSILEKEEKRNSIKQAQAYFNFPSYNEGEELSAFNLMLLELYLRKKCGCVKDHRK
mmetsp:Transcript_19135/g.49728  ORF Transcript_19135/g.49728 Transcript_19135/m.49728 type:complete len:408 (-) Transcript_19135:674-1897(-)